MKPIVSITTLTWILAWEQPDYALCGKCTSSANGVKDSILVLSDDLVEANTAQERCTLLGGSVAMTDDPQINETLIHMMAEKYTKDHVRVWIFYNIYDKNRFGFSLHKNSTASYWKSTEGLGYLSFLDFFKSSRTDNTTIGVVFCTPAKKHAPSIDKWSAGTKQCREKDGWRLEFSFSARKSSSPGYKRIYLYHIPAVWSTFLSDANITYNNTYPAWEEPFFVPDVFVLIGARYNTSLNAWYWSDGSPANFPNADVTTCQQRALHYRIGWEQSSVNCHDKPAYYACQVKLNPSVKMFDCDNTTVNVTWSGLSQVISVYNFSTRVEAIVFELNFFASLPYSAFSVTVANLKPSTIYTAQVTAKLTGCDVISVTSKIQFTTPGTTPQTCFQEPTTVGTLKNTEINMLKNQTNNTALIIASVSLSVNVIVIIGMVAIITKLRRKTESSPEQIQQIDKTDSPPEDDNKGYVNNVRELKTSNLNDVYDSVA